jgi:hypothetical protein
MLLVVNILIPPVAVNQCNVVLPTWRGMMNYWLPNKQIPEGTNPGIALRACRDKQRVYPYMLVTQSHFFTNRATQMSPLISAR